MSNSIFYPIVFLFLSSLLFSCSNQTDSQNKEPKIQDRDYSQSQVSHGKILYQKHCQSCHQEDAKGVADYKILANQGVFVAPALNDNSMLWHRDFKEIQNQIKKGTMRFKGGSMPSFEQKLTDSEINSIIFYLMSLGSNQTYDRWKREVNQTDL